MWLESCSRRKWMSQVQNWAWFCFWTAKAKRTEFGSGSVWISCFGCFRSGSDRYLHLSEVSLSCFEVLNGCVTRVGTRERWMICLSGNPFSLVSFLVGLNLVNLLLRHGQGLRRLGRGLGCLLRAHLPDPTAKQAGGENPHAEAVPQGQQLRRRQPAATPVKTTTAGPAHKPTQLDGCCHPATPGSK